MICVEAGGCGFGPVFPWSMSDFKPGEKILKHIIETKGLLCPKCALMLFKTFPVNRIRLTDFLMQGDETPGRV
jgi:hypothetical protein